MDTKNTLILDTIQRMCVYSSWIAYEAIRRGLPASAFAPTSRGKKAILRRLASLESDGFIRSRFENGIKVWTRIK